MSRSRPLALACTLGLVGLLTSRPEAIAAPEPAASANLPESPKGSTAGKRSGERKPTVRIIGNGVEMDLPLDWDESFSIQVPTTQLEAPEMTATPGSSPARGERVQDDSLLLSPPSATPTPSVTVTPEPVASNTPPAEPSPLPVAEATRSPAPSPVPTPSPATEPSPSAAATPAPTPEASLSATPTPEPAPEASPSATPTPEPAPVASPSAPAGPGLPSPEPAPELLDRVPSPAPTLQPAPKPRATPVAVDPIEALRRKARILAADGRYRDALDLLDEALMDHDEDPRLHAQRGSVLYVMGDVAGARKAWLRALARDPGNQEVREFLGWLDRRDRSPLKRR